jgi:hypothetical protein
VTVGDLRSRDGHRRDASSPDSDDMLAMRVQLMGNFKTQKPNNQKPNRMKTIRTFIMAAIVLSATAGPSPALTFNTAFTVGGFPMSNGNLAPEDLVSGNIVWMAPNIHSEPQSFVSIDLTIDGHTYTVPELGHFNVLPNRNGIGGLIADANGIWNQTDDFWISWDGDSLMPLSFAYASSKLSGTWSVFTVFDPGCFQSFQITPVPEPSAAALLMCSAAAVLWRRRGRDGFKPRGNHGA